MYKTYPRTTELMAELYINQILLANTKSGIELGINVSHGAFNNAYLVYGCALHTKRLSSHSPHLVHIFCLLLVVLFSSSSFNDFIRLQFAILSMAVQLLFVFYHNIV
eukprot:634015_1